MAVIDWTPLKGQMLPRIDICRFFSIAVSSIDFLFCNKNIKNFFTSNILIHKFNYSSNTCRQLLKFPFNRILLYDLHTHTKL